jgi:chemotaxis protein CheX
MIVDPSSEMVVGFVKSVFTTMLDIQVSVAESAGSPAGDHLTAAVYFEGEWQGAVLLECTREQASLFAGSLLGIDPPEEFNDDVRDALGELANMIGGNIKSVLAPEDRLSMPSVIHGSNYEICICGSEVNMRVGFEFDGGLFWITILGKAKRKKAVHAGEQVVAACDPQIAV